MNSSEGYLKSDYPPPAFLGGMNLMKSSEGYYSPDMKMKRDNPIYPWDLGSGSGSGYSKRQKKKQEEEDNTPQVEYCFPGQDTHSRRRDGGGRRGGGRYSLREFCDPRLGHAQFLKDKSLNPFITLPPKFCPLQVTVKRASKTVYQVVHSARANAVHNHGLDPDRLMVAEAFVGKGFCKKRLSYHAKMRHGIMVKAECRLTVVVRESTPEEEAKIAKIKVHNFKKLTKRERQLVPHKLIESTPVWGRKNKASSHTSQASKVGA